uniref:ABC transporter domain-containing protein n=1 Tax=Arundo donax TaxID=35708 RepID=A0A0A9AFY2_ARUDO
MGRNSKKVVAAGERLTPHARVTESSAAANQSVMLLKDQSARSLAAVKPKFSAAPLVSKAKDARSKPTKSFQPSSYLAGIDLPPSYDDEDDVDEHAAKPRASLAPVDLNVAAPPRKEVKKEERRKLEAAAREAAAALWDDPDAYVVTISGRVLTAADSAAAASAANARDFVVEDFDVSVGGVTLFEGVTLRVSHGRRYGLVGPNGKGKSTLLKLLNWRKLPVPRNTRVMLVVQEDNSKDERPVIEVVLAADEELAKLLAERDELEASGDSGNGRLSKVYDELTLLGWETARARASKILAGLGFDQAKQARPARSFSGGWIKRIALAGALFVQPTLLLLDEPTNHLDLQAVLWLEEYLSAQCKSTLIVVSHEEGFLNSVCDEIIHLQDKKLHAYRGSFDSFVSAYEQKKVKAMKEHEKLAKAARKGGRKAPKKWHDYSVEFHFAVPTELPGRPLLRLTGAGFSYDGFKLYGVDADISMGQRVAVVGPNGSGKSTLLKLLAGEIAPTEGEARRSHKLRIGFYTQHFCDSLPKDKSAVQYLLERHPHLESKPGEARAILGKFGLPKENHLSLINKLSGGQKARVVLASIALGEPHVLLLDEPTNNLDMQSIDALADALDEFAGGVVIVSHDSRLITRVCDDETRSEVWVVQDGTVRTYDGTFSEYRDELLEDIRMEMATD